MAWIEELIPCRHYGMTISSEDIKKLRAGDWGFVKRLQANIGCEINIPDEEYPREDPREVGFWGTSDRIKAAKVAIEERMVSRSSMCLMKRANIQEGPADDSES
jgi:hypothetical protein